CARSNRAQRPRASTIEPILRLHALINAISETISGDGPGAVQLWSRTPLTGSAATPLELLQSGRIDEMERAARSLIFGRSRARVPAWRLLRLADIEDEPSAGEPAPPDYSEQDFG